MKILAIDIGGTKIKLGYFEGGKVTVLEEIDTNAREGAKRVVERVIEKGRRYLPVDMAAVATCGQVNPANGAIHYANDNMPGYTGMKVRNIMEEAFRVPVTVENDAYAAAIGEGAFGCGKGVSDYICLTFGTGIGGGVILNGRPYYGAGYNCGTMIGAMLLHPDRRNGSDPWAGTFERYASVTALVKQAMAFSPELSDGRKVFASMGVPAVKQIVDDWLDEVAWGLVSLEHIYNVPLMILGGGVMEQEYAALAIQKKVNQRLAAGFRGLEIKKAVLGNMAGMYGAAAAALRLASDGHMDVSIE